MSSQPPPRPTLSITTSTQITTLPAAAGPQTAGLTSAQPGGPSSAAPAPDSPRASESPPPPGDHGDIELELIGLANALYNLGTTVVNDSTKDKDKPGGGNKPVGQRVNDVVSHLAALDELARNVRTMIPMQVLSDVDNSKNPMQITKDRIERAATENQFMNGKIAAIRSYNELLEEALCHHFPDLVEALRPPAPVETGPGPSMSTSTNDPTPPVPANTMPNGVNP